MAMAIHYMYLSVGWIGFVGDLCITFHMQTREMLTIQLVTHDVIREMVRLRSASMHLYCTSLNET